MAKRVHPAQSRESDSGGRHKPGQARSALQRFTHRLPDANQSLALGTWALAALALWAVLDNRSALERSQRAWLAPFKAEQNIPLKKDSNFEAAVSYHNSGKEPALEVSSNVVPVYLPLPGAWQFGRWNEFDTGPNDTCDGPFPEIRWTVYPSVGTENKLFAKITDLPDIQHITDPAVVLVLKGCIRYKTIGEIHYSGFCFFLQPEYGKPSNEWLFRDCRRGSYSD